MYAKIGDVTIVHVDLTGNPLYESHAYEMLDTNERNRANRFDSDAARRRFVLCRAALRSYLNMMGIVNSDLSFTMERNESPRALVRGREIRCNFNVSHTEDHGLLAFSENGRIGVDIERRNERYATPGELLKVFSKHEQKRLELASHAERAELFMKLWTLKEAFIKAIGEGFRVDTTTFTIPDSILNGDQDCVVVRFEALSDATWELHRLQDNRFVAAFVRELV